MTDAELIARLRLYGSKFHHEFGHNDAADRIEALSGLNKKLTLKVSHYSDLLYDQLGTPCEQIRHKQEIEALEAKLELAKKGLRKIIRTSDMHSAWDIAIATVEKLE